MPDQVRLLIVEDEWLIAEEHADVLAKAGYAIVGPAPSVSAAMKLIDSEQMDGAILDIGLNGETSYAVADHLIEQSVPFIFVSGYSVKDLPERLKSQRILGKPPTPSALLEAIRKMLAVTA